MTSTDRLLQLLNQRDQLCNSFLQPCDRILAVLKGGLLKPQKSLKVHNPIPQEKGVFGTMVNPVMGRLPLLGENHVVLLNGVLDNVGRSQNFLSVLLGIRFDLMDLGSVGPPFHLCIVHLQEVELVDYQKAYSLFSYLGFQLHYPG